MSLLAHLRALATANGLTVKDCGNGHIQVVGGPFLVNWWPDSKRRTLYVAGVQRGGRGFVSPADVISAALNAPCIVAKPSQRRGSYRAVKMTMLGCSKVCRWCRCKLSIDGKATGTVRATLDHVIPLSRGGLDNPNNYCLACEPCNAKRGNDMPEVSERTEYAPPIPR